MDILFRKEKLYVLKVSTSVRPRIHGEVVSILPEKVILTQQCFLFYYLTLSIILGPFH